MCVGLVSSAPRKSFFGYIDRKQSEKWIEKGSFLHCTPTFMKSHFKTLRNNQIWQKKLEEKQQKPKIFDIRPITRLDWISIARL